MSTTRIRLVVVLLWVLCCVADQVWAMRPIKRQPAGLAQATEAAESLTPRDPIGIRPGSDPFQHISQSSLLGNLEQLIMIGAHSGWRLSTTSGEAEAIAWVKAQLEQMPYLTAIGLETRIEPVRTFLGIELHQSRLEIQIEGSWVEVPADGLPGHREHLDLAIRFDTDGQINDSASDPVQAEGQARVVRTLSQLNGLTANDVQGQIVLLDFALIDRSILGVTEAVTRASRLVALDPAGIVPITSFSNVRGESHGSFATFLSAFAWVAEAPNPPILVIRLEDLEPFGITGMGGLGRISNARLTCDADLFSPGHSANLIARIPGASSDQAVMLGAHIDSPNTPGSLDDGSGSVAILEVARVLDLARARPPYDLYLTWYGSHERGLYGSSSFVAQNQDIVDRLVAMLQIDCLSRPLDGIDAYLNLESWSFARHGSSRLPWPDYLASEAAGRGITAVTLDHHALVSDNSSYAAFGVPNINLIYMNPFQMDEVHYDGHLHDAYETIELAAEEADTLEAMAHIALTAAVRTGYDRPDLDVAQRPSHRAVFVASHTEAQHMGVSSLTDLGMSLVWNGYAIDIVPYGQAVTEADLEDADLVVVLPVHDYPSPEGQVDLYDEALSPAEIQALLSYADSGGLLVITNAGRRLKYVNFAYEINEDWGDMNALTQSLGISFTGGELADASAQPVSSHSLMQGVPEMELGYRSGVRFDPGQAQVLANAGSDPAVALLATGLGEVLVLADLGLLGSRGNAINLPFWNNLARHAASR